MKILLTCSFFFILTGLFAQQDSVAISILDKYIASIGGKEKILKVKSVITFSTCVIDGNTYDIEKYYKLPDKFVKRLLSMGVPVERWVYDGNKGMSDNVGKVADVLNENLAELNFEAKPFIEMNYKELGFMIKYDSIQYIDEKAVHVIKLVSPSQRNYIEYYDEEGFKVRRIEMKPNSESTISLITDYSDYREVNGILFPFTSSLLIDGKKISLFYSNIEVDSKIRDDFFTTTIVKKSNQKN